MIIFLLQILFSAHRLSYPRSSQAVCILAAPIVDEKNSTANESAADASMNSNSSNDDNDDDGGGESSVPNDEL